MRTIVIIGDDRHIENIVKETRGRVDRGFITVTESDENEVKLPNAPKEPKKAKAPKATKAPRKVNVPKADSKKVVADTKAAPEPDTKDVNTQA